MSPDKQRIAIAEACGWKRLPCAENDMLWPCAEYVTDPDAKPSEGTRGMIMRPPVRSRHGAAPPDYLADLNAAMQAAAHFKNEVMDLDQWDEFGRWLMRLHPTADLYHPDRHSNDVDFYDFATLMTDTPASRVCEALLKASNLWTND
jgi:hypothetical protein